jgi:hypothetical protein
MGAQVLGGTTQRIWYTGYQSDVGQQAVVGTQGTQYTSITGYTNNDPNAYLVKLGGVVLTGSQSYSITNWTNPDTGVNEGKLILTDYPTYGYELEVRALQVGAAATSLSGTLVAPVREVVSVESAAATGTINLDLGIKQIYLYGSATNDFTLNLRSTPGEELNSMLSAAGTSVSAVVMVEMGASLKALTAVQIDGVAQTVKWLNSTKTLTASKLNVISLAVVKTGSGAYKVVGSVSAAGTV